MVPAEERVLIWGGGGHGRVVADVVRAAGHRIVGFVDAAAEKLGTVVEPGGSRVIYSEDNFLQHLRAAGTLPAEATGVVLAIGSNAARYRCLERLAGVPLPVMVHPAATVSPSAVIGPGTVVMPRAVINAGARIGPGCIVNSGAIVEHDCLIGAGVHVSPGGILAGGAHAEDRSWIGSGAVVLPQRRLGADAVVGAGAVVVRDVERNATVAGVPAQQIH